MTMKIIVLGAAAGGGFPQWNCACANCERTRSGDPRALPQSQSSLAISADGQHWFLLNASPDLRQQIAATKALQPRESPRHSPIAGVVLTNGDVDHIAGLLNLREKQPLTLYGTRRILDVLGANRIFDVLDPSVVRRCTVALERPTPLALPDGRDSGLTVEAFPVPGKVALYLEDASAGPGFGTMPEDTIGLRVAQPSDGRAFYYIPGCAKLSASLSDRLRGAQLVFFDGTLWQDDEMICNGTGEKTGTRMGHMSISGPEGSLAAFAGLGVTRKLYIHLNNTNPVLVADTPERAAVREAGWEVAQDGMEVAL